MAELQVRETGVVIPFPDAASRALRVSPALNGPRGEILLFTGIRYESRPETGPSAPVIPGGSPRNGRRRRRS